MTGKTQYVHRIPIIMNSYYIRSLISGPALPMILPSAVHQYLPSNLWLPIEIITAKTDSSGNNLSTIKELL